MIYGHSLLTWLLIVGVFVGCPLASIRTVRHRLGPPILRLWSWASAQLSPPTELDKDADDLSKILKRQQLCSEIQRLQRILATDLPMSATRQIANRLAYAQLVRELEDVPDFYGTIPNNAVTRLYSSGHLPRTESQPQPRTVEILEIGWRRRVQRM